MQQSFGTQVAQSNLTDCSHRTDIENNDLIDLPDNENNNNSNTSRHRILSIGERLIPLLILIPWILCTIILFIWSFIITSAWLHILLDITAPYSHKSVFSMNKIAYDLSIQHSLNDLSKSGSYGLAIAVLLLSFIFPIIKLLYILFLILLFTFKDKQCCIKCIPKWLKPDHKNHSIILIILEMLNKYSFINIFILVILMSCIYINIDHDLNLTQDFVPSDVNQWIPSFHVISTIIIEPDTGIVLFAIAMIMSCSLTIIIKYRYIPFYTLPDIKGWTFQSRFHDFWNNGNFYHHSQQSQDDTDYEQIQTSSSRESTQAPQRRRRRYSEPQSPLLFSKNYSFRTFCIKMTSFMFFVFVVIGAITIFIAQIPFIEIVYIGDLSKFMTNPGSKRIYSLDGIVQSVDNENNDGNTKFLRIIYELFGIVFPLITIVLLILLWMIPMPKWIHIRLKGIIWCTHMLNAIDVVIISCIIIAKELPSLFKYIVQHQYADYCQSLYNHFGSKLCETMEIKIFLHNGLWTALAFYISLWIVVIYSVLFKKMIIHQNN